VLWIDELVVIGDGDVGVHQDRAIEFAHDLLVLLECQILLLFLLLLGLRCVLETLQLFFAEFCLLILLVSLKAHLFDSFFFEFLHFYLIFFVLEVLLLLLLDDFLLDLILRLLDDLLQFLDLDS
jgi:hypothetical protein